MQPIYPLCHVAAFHLCVCSVYSTRCFWCYFLFVPLWIFWRKRHPIILWQIWPLVSKISSLLNVHLKPLSVSLCFLTFKTMVTVGWLVLFVMSSLCFICCYCVGERCSVKATHHNWLRSSVGGASDPMKNGVKKRLCDSSAIN